MTIIKEVIPLAFNSVPFLNLTEDSYNDFGPSQIDKHIDSATGFLTPLPL